MGCTPLKKIDQTYPFERGRLKNGGMVKRSETEKI